MAHYHDSGSRAHRRAALGTPMKLNTVPSLSAPTFRSALRKTLAFAPAITAAACFGLLAPPSAHAQDEVADEEPPDEGDGAAIDDDRVSPLAGQPAVRNRQLLTSERFELTPTVESTINAPFRHTVSGGLKGEYHLTSTWSVGAIGLFGYSFNNGLTNRVLDDLDEEPGDIPEPSRDQFEQRLNSIPVHGAGYVGFKPFQGKLSAFGSLFLRYNIYVNGGLSFAVLENDCCTFDADPNDGDPRTDPPNNDGTEVGLYGGAGIQVFMSEFLALDLSVRDYFFRNNPTGVTGDLQLTSDDNRLRHHVAASLGVSIFFPLQAERSP